jgi:predicted ArsR family transcriptional regulator
VVEFDEVALEDPPGRLPGRASLDRGVEEGDDRTRDRIRREVMLHGPVTAGQVAHSLQLGQNGVRRHLDQMLVDGAIEVWETPREGRRGRGRPARRFVLTESGHAAASTAYDDLAVQALAFLGELAGQEAVRHFADRRAGRLGERYGPAVEAVGGAPQQRAEALAGALNADGYAASIRSVSTGTQLCQGHCPVQHVAARFPQLCEAETRAFSQLLGVHVQRLATLAHGDHVCTTHIPTGNPRQERTTS